ncbi:MAG: hypothetical protein CM15mP8_0800 [Methanobacteriota archaeon]|nr:MAG: hypothetical protein CM15mP8_0800 [Euryarchaeota archaeon]
MLGPLSLKQLKQIGFWPLEEKHPRCTGINSIDVEGKFSLVTVSG